MDRRVPATPTTPWLRSRFRGIQPAEPALFSDDRISVTVERIAISPIGMSIGLATRIHFTDRRINGMWPWTVAHEDASTEHAPFMLARSPADVCRFGVRYSDGSWVASGTGFETTTTSLVKQAPDRTPQLGCE